MTQAALDHIANFRAGRRFSRPARGLVAQGQPDPAALQVLGQALATEPGPVREELVALLVDLGLQTDPLTPRGAEVLRHPGIIALLFGPGLGRQDTGRDAALDALRKLCLREDLRRHGADIARTLQQAPTPEAFLLAAKAKAPEVMAVLQQAAAAAGPGAREAVRIARAAHGDAGIEADYIAALDAATDAAALVKALGPLALIGTQAAMVAVALRMRSPLTLQVPGAFEKSVRLNVMEALLYNHPDHVELYPNNVLDANGYRAVEAFCMNAYGVRYSAPVPPFLTYRGHPIPAR